MWFRSAAALILAASLSPAALAGTESEDWRALRDASATKSRDEASSLARSFIKNHPQSDHIADARMLLADNETDPARALPRYDALAEKFRNFSRKDEARLSLCRILFLQSRFAECAEEAQKGSESRSAKELREEFVLLRAKALCAQQRYDEASDTLKGSGAAEAKNIRAEIATRNGDSGAWAELVKGDYPETALFCLAREYEADGMKDEAFSAYSDLIKKYPHSLEALSSVKPKAALAKRGAKYKAVPAAKRQKLERLRPEREITETDSSSEEYSVLVGPFYNLKEAGKIKKEMTAEFGRAVIVKREKEFVIYVGRAPAQEDAVSMKIRLAEEFGFNGAIVNIREEDNREYFYGQ